MYYHFRNLRGLKLLFISSTIFVLLGYCFFSVLTSAFLVVKNLQLVLNLTLIFNDCAFGFLHDSKKDLLLRSLS